MTTWPCLLISYSHIDVALPRRLLGPKRFSHALPKSEIDDAIESFACFPSLVSDLTYGEVEIRYEVTHSRRPLTTLTRLENGGWWPSPNDTKTELQEFEVERRYASVFVFWPQNNHHSGKSIKSCGWGLGMGASSWSMQATYATVANAETDVWNVPVKGEVWLHEWLHGACAHFASRGYKMPDGGADGGDRHGYIQSPETGWTTFYRDLMNGRVIEKDKSLGIPTLAWKSCPTHDVLI